MSRGRKPEFTTCETCKKESQTHFFCECDPDHGPWCADCFEMQPCLRNHSSDCKTKIIEMNQRKKHRAHSS